MPNPRRRAEARGQIYALDQKLDFKYEILVTKIDGLEGRIKGLDEKIEGFRREFSAETRRVEETLSGDTVRMEGILDARMAAVESRLVSTNEKIDLVRRELLAEMKVAR